MGNWLKEIRIDKGLTQEKAATLSGIGTSYYGMIETGVRRPSPENAKKIANALEFDWTRFYDPEKQTEE